MWNKVENSGDKSGCECVDVNWTVQERRYVNRISRGPQNKSETSPNDIVYGPRSAVRNSLTYRVQSKSLYPEKKPNTADAA